MDIVYEDTDIIIVCKPPGTPSQPDKTGDENMLHIACAYTCEKLHIVHRLDRPVGGLLIFAKNSFVCAKLSSDFSNKRVVKRYVAVVCGNPGDSGNLRHLLLKNQRLNVSRAVKEGTSGAKEAILQYNLLEERDGLCLIEVEPLTGRHHQIRVQFAAAGWPLWGDTKYNNAFSRPAQFVFLALWAYKLAFVHPRTGKNIELCLTPPQDKAPFDRFSVFANSMQLLKKTPPE